MVDKLTADHLAAQAGSFEPQRNSNFLLELSGTAVSSDDAEVIRLSTRTATGPVQNNEPIADHFLNEERWVPGRTTYEVIPIGVRDFVDAGSLDAIKRWSQKVANPVDGKIGLAKDIKVEARLLMFAPDGTQERSWLLGGAFPSKLKHGDWDMSGNDLVMIEFDLRYDKAYWEPIGERPGA